MKKIVMIFAVGLACVSLAISQSQKKEAAPENSDIANLHLAYELATYGYANDSASSLLQAAEIITQIPKQKADIKTEKAGTSAENPNKAKSDFSASTLIADAKKLAGKDKNLLDWAASLEKVASKSTRGATGGALYSQDSVYGKGTTTFYAFFDASRLAEVTVRPFDNVDLDLYIYDEQGNLIVSETSYAPGAYCSFMPYYTTNFRIVVKNNSNYNVAFEIFTN